LVARFFFYIPVFVKHLLAISLLLLSPLCFASVEQRTLATLAKHHVWLKLLNYEDALLESAQSAVTSPEFFISPDGRHDPLLEMQATIRAFTSATSGSGDEHPGCRFPARWIWLSEQLPQLFAGLGPAHCPRYLEWTGNNTVESISVIFATGFLGNPASYYGHTMLKLNFTTGVGASGLLDSSLNYGAIVPNDENMLRYIYKGVTGGYEGGFSQIGFYFHNHNYGDNELRDLWEYRLNLRRAEVNFVLAHAWEVLGKKYDYYFFRRNCAFRMAKLLEIAGDLDLVPAYRPWTIPQAHVQMIAQTARNGQPLVSDVLYHPSRQSRFYGRYSNLNDFEKQLLARLISKTVNFEGNGYTSLPTANRKRVLDALMDYWQFVGSPWPKASEEIRQQHAMALKQRFKEPGGSNSQPLSSPGDPAIARAPSYVGLGAGFGAGSQNGLRVRIRPAYYDALDASNGHVPNASLTMGELWLANYGSRTTIERFDLVSIDSVAPGVSGLPGDSPHLWGLRLSAEQRVRGCTSCLTPKLHGSIGRKWNPASSVFVGAELSGNAQSSKSSDGMIQFGARASVIMTPVHGAGIRLLAERRYFASSKRKNSTLTSVEGRLELTRNHDLRVAFVRDPDAKLSREWRLMTGYYW
jgi:Domain of unknown function (DUF4105)